MTVAGIEIDGLTLEYQLISAQRSDRPPLVFLHEGLGSVDVYKRQSL